jgi:predicted TIM-barrel fold metal-dependent hydrolase
MIIDANANVGRSLYGPELTVEEVVRRIEASGIDRAVVSPFTPPDLDFRRANHAVAAAMEADWRLIGFARIDPRLGEVSLRELETCRSDGLRGVKVDPFEQAFQINSNLVFDFFEACGVAQMPVLVVAGYPVVSTPIQIGDLAERLPELTLLIAHGGQLAMHGLGIFDCLNVVQSNPNVYVESSGIPETGTESLIERAVLEASAERVVFGTNMPINHPQMELERIRVAAISETARQQILGSNMAKILALR